MESSRIAVELYVSCPYEDYQDRQCTYNVTLGREFV
jgi:hypothetical protein